MLTFNLKAKMLLGKSLLCPISVLPVDQSPSKVNRSISESSKYSSDDFLQWGHTVRRHATCMNEYLGVPQIGSGDSHFIVSMMKHQSRRDPHIHKDVAGTAQGTGNAMKNQIQEVSTLWEFPLR